MQFRSIPLLILAAAATSRLAIHSSKAYAQSMPAGEITSRMKSALPVPEQIIPELVPDFSDIISQPAQAVPAARAMPPDVLNNITSTIQQVSENAAISPQTKDLLLKSLSRQLVFAPAPNTQAAHNPMTADALNSIANTIKQTQQNPSLTAETKDQLLKSFGEQLAAAPASTPPIPAPNPCSANEGNDKKMESSALGTARKDAWHEVVVLDDAIPFTNDATLTGARKMACAITDALDFKDALHLVQRTIATLNQMTNVDSTQKALQLAGINDILNFTPIQYGETEGTKNSAKDAKNKIPPCWQTAVSDSSDTPQNSNSAGQNSGGVTHPNATGQESSSTAPGSSSANPPAGNSKQNSNAAKANNSKSSTATITYQRPWFLPLYRNGCHDDAQILDFFNVSGKADAGNSVQYLYNAQQSASAVTGDLVTTSFAPGLQLVLAGTATVGTGTSTSSTSGSSSMRGNAWISSSSPSSTSTTSTDTVSTALAKLENGGDFNLRVPAPLIFKSTGNWSVNGSFLPNIGFTLNKFGGQQTITQATEYSGNFPAELYMQIGSVKDPSGNSVPAIGFFDARAAGEWISSALAQKLGASASTFFPIIQVSGGVEFAQRFRLSFQYIYSTPQFCQVSGNTSCSTSGTSSGATASTTKINGFHVAVSFSPQKSKNSRSSD